MDKLYAHFKSAFVKNGRIWCVPWDSNDLVQIDLSDWSIIKVTSFEMTETSFINYIFYSDDVVWCVLSNAAEIISYNLLSKEKRSFSLPLFQEIGAESVFYKNRIWMFSRSLSKDVICFNIETKTCESSENWKLQIVKKGYGGTRGNIFVADGIVYIPILHSSVFIEFRLEDGSVRQGCLPINIQMGAMARKENCYYFTEFDRSSIVRWNKQTDTIEKFCHPEQFNCNYKNCMVLDSKILLIDAGRFDYLDENLNRIVTDYNLSKHCISREGGHMLFADMLKDGDQIYLLPWMADEMLIYNFSCDQWCSQILELPKNISYDCIKKRMKSGNYLKETSLDDYLNYIVKYTI